HTKAFLPVNFERFTGGRLSYIPGNVKLWESAGRAGGLPCYLGIEGRYFLPGAKGWLSTGRSGTETTGSTFTGTAMRKRPLQRRAGK
ncbi:MAG: hypothetical protein WAN11_26405, partial [Syntrophobacteraceae bacterium]